MSWGYSSQADYGAELRAAAREFEDHGWSVIPETSSSSVLVRTGSALDVVEVPITVGRQVCSALRAVGIVVPVAASPPDRWWFPVRPGAPLRPELASDHSAVLRAEGSWVVAPPSTCSGGLVHWRVSPSACGWRLPHSDVVQDAIAEAVRWRVRGGDGRPGAQRPAAVAAGVRT